MHFVTIPFIYLFLIYVSIWNICWSKEDEAVTDTTPLTYVFMPSTFYLDETNQIVVRTKHENTKMKMTIEFDQYSLVFNDTFIYNFNKLDKDWYGIKLNYKFPFTYNDLDTSSSLEANVWFNLIHCSNDLCDDFLQITTIRSINIRVLPWLILSETDKPIYRPKELVRFRFLAINPIGLSPSRSLVDVNLPKYKLVVDKNKKSAKLESILEEEQSKLQLSNIYNKIYIKDVNDNRVQQWLDLNPIQASNLNFSLLTDAIEGEWKIIAEIGKQKEVLKFTVARYTLPRFTMDIKEFTLLHRDSKYAHFSVCAKYTNGPFITGMAQSALCICHKQTWSNNFKKSKDEAITNLFKSQSCPNLQGSCILASQLLSKQSGCAKFNLSIIESQLGNQKVKNWDDISLLCIRVKEEGTGSMIQECKTRRIADKEKIKLEIDAPSVHKHNLPIFVTINLLNTSKLFGRTLNILVKEHISYCMITSKKVIKFYHTFTVQTDLNGQANFTIGPFGKHESIMIRAYLVDIDNEEKKRLSVNSYNYMHGRDRTNTGELYASTIIEPWMSATDANLQLWPRNNIINAKCPGPIQLKLIANVPLNNATIYIESVIKGKHILITIPPQSKEDECLDIANQFGHYKCKTPNSNEISCLPGWTGPNCIKPMCSTECNLKQGNCLKPNECLCYPGWSGSNCDQCDKLNGCVNGKCVKGNDCVCDSNWYGYLCNNETNTDENDMFRFNKEHVYDNVEWEVNHFPKNINPIRTLFERNIEIELNSEWGPNAYAVIYIHYLENNFPYLVGTGVQIEQLDTCIDKSIAAEFVDSNLGINFNKVVVHPGEDVKLTISRAILGHDRIETGMENKSVSSIDELCFLRISDKSLDNFNDDSAKKVNLNVLSIYLKQIFNKYQNIFYPTSTEEVFEKAGLMIGSSYPQISIRKQEPLCFATYASSSVNNNNNNELMVSMAKEEIYEDSEPILTKPRLREIFPEVWLFETIAFNQLQFNNSVQLSGQNVEMNLVAPDTITSWRASAFCTTRSNGLWISKPKSLTVTMPFYIAITMPKSVKRGEILHLPISVFVTDVENAQSMDTLKPDKKCYEISLKIVLNQSDWTLIGSETQTRCLCIGDKETFIASILPKTLGKLNFTVEASANPNSVMCNTNISLRVENVLSDKLRRQIEVLPEGKRSETIITDILCLEETSKTIEQKYPITLPPNIIKDSMRIYAQYTDEILGPVLENLDDLIQLPHGCGEQNMVLIAPNIYALGYLTSIPRLDEKKTQNMILTIKQHIVKGYKQQLKYQRTDGSFSAFGQSDNHGSTWLTAFVLKVFVQAYKIDSKLDLDWKNLFKTSFEYLISQQDPNTGCFKEQGRILHSGMQGGLGNDQKLNKILLTTYVSSVMTETKSTNETLWSTLIQGSINLSIQCIETHLESIHTEVNGIKNLDTYSLILLTNDLTNVKPNSNLTKLFQIQMFERKQIESNFLTNQIHWSDCEESNNSSSSYECNLARDVEATAYAYLILAKDKLYDDLQLMPIIKWILSKQNSQGGFSSTQDTILSLQAIADFATRLGLKSNYNKNLNSLSVETYFDSLNFKFRELITTEKRQVLNQIELPQFEIKDVKFVIWKLKSTKLKRECLTVKTAFVYNVPEISLDKNNFHLFKLLMKIEQSDTANKLSCLKSCIDVCLKPTSQTLNTGMLLITINIITGWETELDKISAQLDSKVESPRRFTVKNDNMISFYFDGFSKEEFDKKGNLDGITRCVKVYLKQTIYIENPQPGTVTGQRYYAPDDVVTSMYNLNQCRTSWNINSRHKINAKPMEKQILHCTQCVENIENPLTTIELLQNVTNVLKPGTMFLLKIYKMIDSDLYSAIIFRIFKLQIIESWNTKVHLNDAIKCPCPILKPEHTFIYISPNALHIYSGDLTIKLNTDVADNQLISITQLMQNLDLVANNLIQSKQNPTMDKIIQLLSIH